jgi:uncharacterized protein (DUF1697 family)
MAVIHVAFLRAVNVAGHASLAMADLRKLGEGLGFTNVKTLLQSGNLVFDAGAKKAPALESALEAALKQHGIETDFMVRRADELDGVIAANPFPKEAKTDPGHLVVMFLKDAPGAQAIVALQAAVKGREVIRHKGRELYIVYPDGIGRSKLTNKFIESRLDTRATGRNWNTVTKLAGLAGA